MTLLVNVDLDEHFMHIFSLFSFVLVILNYELKTLCWSLQILTDFLGILLLAVILYIGKLFQPLRIALHNYVAIQPLTICTNFTPCSCY